MVKAVAVLTKNHDKHGTVSFTQEGSDQTTIRGSDFAPGDYALVVHVKGDMTDPPKSMGPRFKKVGTQGLLAFITIGPDGTFILKMRNVPLSGPSSIIGRGFVAYAFRPGLNTGPGEAWGLNAGHEVDWTQYAKSCGVIGFIEY